MNTMTDTSDNKPNKPLIRRLRSILARTTPVTTVEIKGAEFGRRVEKSLAQMSDDHMHFMLNVRKKNRAVVIGIEEYESLMELRSTAAELSEQYEALKLQTEGDKFEQVFAKMQSAPAKSALDDFFDMDEDELDIAQSYRGGETEQ